MPVYVVKGEPLSRSLLYWAHGLWRSDRRRARRFHSYEEAKAFAKANWQYRARVMRLRKRDGSDPSA